MVDSASKKALQHATRKSCFFFINYYFSLLKILGKRDRQKQSKTMKANFKRNKLKPIRITFLFWNQNPITITIFLFSHTNKYLINIFNILD